MRMPGEHLALDLKFVIETIVPNRTDAQQRTVREPDLDGRRFGAKLSRSRSFGGVALGNARRIRT